MTPVSNCWEEWLTERHTGATFTLAGPSKQPPQHHAHLYGHRQGSKPALLHLLSERPHRSRNQTCTVDPRQAGGRSEGPYKCAKKIREQFHRERHLVKKRSTVVTEGEGQ